MQRFTVLYAIVFFLFFFIQLAGAKDAPVQVIVWPSEQSPVLRFEFGKFKQTGSSGREHIYTIETSAANVWNKRIQQANFYLYIYDKSKTRIGEGYVNLTNLGPGESAKFETTLTTAGNPAALSVTPRSLPNELGQYLPPNTISITVNSVPQGADLKIDGQPAGITPKIVQVSPGKHILEFNKEGFNTGTFPLEVAPNDVSGGSVSYELGTSAHDTVELRDGSVLSGDVESVSATEVVVKIGGTAQHLNRNQVKRILLVQRESP